MTWTPETNRIPTGLLTDEELTALKACKHGWEFYNSYEWRDMLGEADWFSNVIYRAKPAPPKRVVMWFNVYQNGWPFPHETREIADFQAVENRVCVYRIERNEDGSDPQIFVEDC